MKRLLSVDEAMAFDRKKVRALYKDFINPGLAGMMGLLDFDKRFVRASGMEVWDSDGEVYLDFLGSYGALNMGHNHPRIIEAMNKVKHTPKMLQASLNPLAAALASNLSGLTQGKLEYSFFCNSGAEAIEAALKTARIYSGKTKILYCRNSFHGKSFGALSVTGREKYQAPFRPMLPGCIQMEYGSLEQAQAHMAPGDIAAVIVEPVQGEGGIIVPPEGYLRGIRDLCDRYRVLMIIDEIQTGMGRTGRYFAYQHEDITPDIICVAKSLGGGMMPAGACICSEDVFKHAYAGIERCMLHTSTFGGNSLSMAAGIAALEVLVEERLDKRAEEMGEYAIDRLHDLKSRHSLIKDVRGRGLMMGIEFHSGEGSLADRLSKGALSQLRREYLGALVAGELLNKHRIITAYTLNNPNVIRLEPPLIVNREQIDRMINALDHVLGQNKNVFRIAVSGAKTAVKGKVFGR